MSEKNNLNEGWQPSNKYGYKPKKNEERGYQPNNKTIGASVPPKGGSNVKPPSSNVKK